MEPISAINFRTRIDINDCGLKLYYQISECGLEITFEAVKYDAVWFKGYLDVDNNWHVEWLLTTFLDSHDGTQWYDEFNVVINTLNIINKTICDNLRS